MSLLDGKLKIDLPGDFSRDPDDPKDPKTVAKFSGPDGAWGAVLRGTHGLTPDKLEGYLKMRVAEYSKGFKWLPKDSHLQWLKKEIVTIDGRKWADWSFVPMLKGKKDYSYNPVYTRDLTTSYKGQLLEITFTSNLNTEPKLKQKIDHIMDSVHLEDERHEFHQRTLIFRIQCPRNTLKDAKPKGICLPDFRVFGAFSGLN